MHSSSILRAVTVLIFSCLLRSAVIFPHDAGRPGTALVVINSFDKLNQEKKKEKNALLDFPHVDSRYYRSEEICGIDQDDTSRRSTVH